MDRAVITPETVAANLVRVRDRIERAGGDPGAVTVVAVTKAFDASVAAAALEAGLVDLGENYAQHLLAKVAAFAEDPPPVAPRWHFIGGLQRNKVRQLAGVVHCYQTVDGPALGTEIARRDPGAMVLVQVNATGEAHKHGCPPSEVAALVRELQGLDLDVRGLMAVGRAGDEQATRSAFDLVNRLAGDLGLPVRSMGMSGDLETAIAAGSTMVRVGRELFGERPDSRVRAGGVGD